MGVGVAIGRAIKLRQRQCGAQFEAARFLRLRDRDRDLQGPFDRRSVGGVALQQDLAADAVYLRFVPAPLGALQLGERVVQASDHGISLACACFGFGFGQGRFETGQVPNMTLLPTNADAPPHLGQPRLSLAAQPSCPALKKCRPAGPKGRKIVSRHEIGQRSAIGCDCFGAVPQEPQPRSISQRITHRRSVRCRLGIGQDTVDKP